MLTSFVNSLASNDEEMKFKKPQGAMSIAYIEPADIKSSRDSD